MAFKFSLQALLKKNKYEEQLAKKKFSEAQATLNKTLEEIQNCSDEIEGTQKNMSQMRASGGTVVSHLEVSTSYIHGLAHKIEGLQDIAREQMEQVEFARQEMIIAVQEYKKLETLRDKRLREYKQKLKKKAEKELDDIIIMRNTHTS